MDKVTLDKFRKLAALSRDEKGRPFLDKNGAPNLVAKVRATRKGEHLMVNEAEVGVAGVNGNRYYNIRLAADGNLYCSCPASKFSGFKACKHVAKAKEVAAAGLHISSMQDAVVYDFAALA